MTGVMRSYIRVVDAVNYRLGRIVMYGIFVMVGILLWSSASKVFFLPSLWTLEMAQFAMVAYYMLGGPYAIQMGSNVRMDLFYHNWSDRRKAWFDAFTVLFLVFYLCVLLWGGISSTAYALGDFSGEPLAFFGKLIGAFFTGGPAAALAEIGHLERSATAWRAYLWPVKTIMCIAIFLMLLQALSEFCKDLLRIRGEEI
jgi:TRAP-type mannitol/chloroaromatic compound transport system permease small subunit